MKKVLFGCIAGCLLSYSQGHAACDNLTGDYTYLNGNGAAKVMQFGNKVTMIAHWVEGDEYLFRTSRNGNKLAGDWALIRERGNNVGRPVFRRYGARINPADCSLVGEGSEDSVPPRGVNGTPIFRIH